MFRHKVEKITPEIAKIYYSRLTGNRVINRQAVKTYIAQMKTGRWVLNGETICFDSNGVLRDALSMYQADFRKLLSPAYIGGVAAFLMLYKGCTKEYVGSTIRFEVVNPNSPRRIVVVKEIPISEIGNLNTFITDPNEDLWEIKKAKEDYYINKLMFLETGPYKVYIKRTGTQVDKLNTCNMSVTSYTITYK